MVLRCSLLGHDYGESAVDREREERGSEVVVTVQTYEECVRCGDKHVISENTEVRSLSTETDAVSHPGTDESAPEREPAPETDSTEATFIDADSTQPETSAEMTETTETTEVAAEPPSISETNASESADHTDDIEIPTDENGDPVTDDGEILDDDGPSTPSNRGHGEWPASDDVGPPVSGKSESVNWPDEESDPLDDDAVLLNTGSANDASTALESDSMADGSAPTGSTSLQGTAPTQGTGIERARTAPTPGSEGGTPPDDVPSEFYCPRCDFVASSDRGSLRTGDICPDCQKGYISERQRS